MTATKFAVAYAQRAKAMTQKIANSQYRSQYRFYQTHAQQADTFVKQNSKNQEKPRNFIAEILNKQNKK